MGSGSIKWICLFLLMVTSLPAHARQANPQLQAIHELRSVAFSVCANVLVYFNQSGSPYEQENQRSYQQGMIRLRLQAEQMKLADVSAELQRLQAGLANTAELPRSVAALRAIEPPYTRVLLPVIESHARLQQLLQAHYRRVQGEERGIQGEINTLSDDMGVLLVGYQIASFSRLGAEQWVLGDEQIAAADQRISAAFERLSAVDANLHEALEHPARQYSFVRGLLLKQDGKWAPNAIERFMERAIADLDEIAHRLPQ